MMVSTGGVQLCLNLLEGYCHPRVPAVGGKAGLAVANNFTLSSSSMDNASGSVNTNIFCVSRIILLFLFV